MMVIMKGYKFFTTAEGSSYESYSMRNIINPNKVHKDCSKINLLPSKIKGSQWKSETDVRFNQENARGRF